MRQELQELHTGKGWRSHQFKLGILEDFSQEAAFDPDLSLEDGMDFLPF